MASEATPLPQQAKLDRGHLSPDLSLDPALSFDKARLGEHQICNSLAGQGAAYRKTSEKNTSQCSVQSSRHGDEEPSL